MSSDILGMTITIGSLLTIITILLSINTFKRNAKKDAQEDIDRAIERETRFVAMEKDIQYIRQSTDNIGGRLTTTEQKLISQSEDIVAMKKEIFELTRKLNTVTKFEKKG